MRRELTDPDRMFSLLSDAAGSYYLEVVCGGAGMYEVRIALTPAQVERYREEGREYLGDLASRVAKGELEDQIVRR